MYFTQMEVETVHIFLEELCNALSMNYLLCVIFPELTSEKSNAHMEEQSERLLEWF